MSRKARRAFARSLGKGPFRPAQLGAAAFSAALLILGAGVLLSIAPPLIQQEMLAQRANVAPLFGGLTEQVAEEDAAHGANAKDAGEAEGAFVNADHVGESGFSGNAAAGFPTLDLTSLKSLANISSSEQESSNGKNPGSADNTIDSADEAPDAGGDSSPSDGSSEIPESDEQANLVYLRQCYDALPTYQQNIAQAYANFPTLAYEPSRDMRFVYLSQAIEIRDSIDIALLNMEENRLPDASCYFNDYLNIKKLYEDLSSAGAILARSWASNVQFDDPTAHESHWMSPIEENSSGGKLTFFADYEARYPGARP